MPIFFRLTVLVILFTAACLAQVECVAYSQVNLTQASTVRYLSLDLPKGASHESKPEFWARTIATPGADHEWRKCNSGSSGTACDHVSFRNISTSDPDGTKIYLYEVSPVVYGSKYNFSGDTGTRLVMRYTLPGPLCVAQYSYGVKGGFSIDVRGLETELMIPAGKTILSEDISARTPRGAWVRCGTVVGTPSSQHQSVNACIPKAGVGTESWGISDPQDQAPGLKTRCGAKGGIAVPVDPYWCRFTVSYAP